MGGIKAKEYRAKAIGGFRRVKSVIVGTMLALVITFALPSGGAIAQSQSGCTKSPFVAARQLSEGAVRLATSGEIPIWKTITLGTYKNVNTIREAMDIAPCLIWIGDDADEILGRPAFPFNKTPVELDLVVLSVFELGFGVQASRNDNASLHDIHARAIALGFELCPAEVGPALRLNYLDQPLGEFLHIAMTPIARYSGELVDFTVGNGGAGLLLVGGNGDPDVMVPGVVRFVFVRPKPIVLR